MLPALARPCVTMNEAPVLIVGGGPVGLAFALGLAHQGVRSILFETKSQVDPHSRALGILPRSLEIFRDWGVYDRFVSEGELLNRIRAWIAGRPNPVFEADLSVFTKISAAGGVLIMPQNRTEELLLESVKAAGHTEVLFEHKVTRFQQDDEGVWADVQAAGGETKSYRGRYLVGCDGAHSTVRQQLGWELKGKTYPTRIFLADIRIQDERDQLPFPLLAPGVSGVLAAVRYQPQHWRIIASLDPGENDQTALEPSSIHARVVRLFGGGTHEQLWSSVFHIHCRTSPHFRHNRVMLAGDAAHINSPAGGQGMNAGIQDAHNLAWKIARVLAGADSESLLSSYEIERRETILKSVDRYTDLLTRFGLAAPEFIRNITGTFLTLLPRVGLIPLVAPKMGMLDAAYTQSPIVSGHGHWVGRRAPDGELIASDESRIRLLDLAGPQPVLLLFDEGRLPAWDPERLKQHFQNIHDLKVALIAPPNSPKTNGAYVAVSPLWRTWNAAWGMAVLVRPDGHVGWMERGPTLTELNEGVRKALGSIPQPAEQ
jgi:2-polyprenyl-6-methoxyphenol hydroxylase-like FAD-dependent oxidoreductase